MRLSRTERWILASQYRILEALYPDEAESLARDREVLERGYELNYDWISEHIVEPAVDAVVCSVVISTFDMFSRLKWSYERLRDGSGIDARDIAFLGFSGNHERDQFGYTRFLVDREGKFKDIGRGLDDFNSHFSTLGQYRRMLAEWERVPPERRFDLARDDVVRIVSAGRVSS